MSSTNDWAIPDGAVASVRIIDSTSSISGLSVSYLMKPPLAGFDTMQDLPTWVFLVESPSAGQKALFDLGIRSDWKNLAPAVVNKLQNAGWDVRAEKNVVEIIREHGIAADEIGSVIWSHWHWDHVGDPSTFPPSTDLVVGPGFQKAFLPAFPKDKASSLLESDFEGRTLREIDFKAGNLCIGPFKAFDFFSDGSFYLLDTPGHAIGHLAGLARTTKNPDTFILMGGDLCHHGGELRPSRFLPIPQEISPHPFLGNRSPVSSCPAAIFESLAKSRACEETGAFFLPAMGADIAEAISTIRKAQSVDRRDDVLFIYAHDTTLRGVVDFFPLSANNWKQKEWGTKLRWSFLRDFEEATQDSNFKSTC